MDSKVVNKQIRAEVRPMLKDAGFTRFTSRSSWRHVGRRIDVVNFQSFNSYNAAVMGCTTYSFAVNVGCYLLDIPKQYNGNYPKECDEELRPNEFECHFRGRLKRSFSQPEYDSRQVWYIDPAGRYLEKALHDVRMAIARDGFPWFERFADRAEVLRILVEEDERMEELWGFGRNPSPIRAYLTGYLALAIGQRLLARQRLEEALASGCFEQVADRIARDIGEMA